MLIFEIIGTMSCTSLKISRGRAGFFIKVVANKYLLSVFLLVDTIQKLRKP